MNAMAYRAGAASFVAHARVQAIRHEIATAPSYAQCWEDADVLLKALDVHPGDTCLSIASGGDNTLALLTCNPRRVIAVDRNPAQLACLALRMAAFRALTHAELLELIGSTPSTRRRELYSRCRKVLPTWCRPYWDARPDAIANGIGAAGRFERYLATFRELVLPLVHRRGATQALLRGGPRDVRERFYARRWDSRLWRVAFRMFFSRAVMGRLGRGASAFDHVEGGVAERLLARTRYALTALDPADNPYLQWICSGRHLTALPFALRPENFAIIRDRLDRLELRYCTLEQFLEDAASCSIDRCNLSDVFEYQSSRAYASALAALVRATRPGGRLVYWNMLVRRRRPPELAGRLRPLERSARELHAIDRAFFYDDLVIEEIRA